MSPRTADPAIRDSLVEAAAELIATHKPLTTRSVAAAVGTSTMAVYTHFGSMEELRRAVRRDGFARLAEHLRSARPTDDPVAWLAELGWGYAANALTNPNLYRVMFMETPIDEQDAGVGHYTFEMLVDAVQRCIDGGRIEDGDAYDMATQIWAVCHGVITLHLAGLLELQEVIRLMTLSCRNLLIAFGDEPSAIDRSFAEGIRLVDPERLAAVVPAG